MTEDRRTVLLVVHTGRQEAVELARQASGKLLAAGLGVRVLRPEADAMALDGVDVVDPPPTSTDAGATDAGATDVDGSDGVAEPVTDGCDLVMVLGGDGTILRGAELAHRSGTPVLGVNLGHVGFLAESESDDLDVTIDHVVRGDYAVEERMTLDLQVRHDGQVLSAGWALNEASLEKATRERMVEVMVEVDGRPLSRWAGDGVVAATPTGSTAYAFSAGGPIVWPQVEAMLLVPLSAHALFARPLVVAPTSVIGVEVLSTNPQPGVLWCDGRRTRDLPPGSRIELRRGSRPVRLARLHHAPFTDRLVGKFDLPVTGWRGRGET